MALKRSTITLTVAAGVASGSAHLHIPSSPTRPCYLEAIAIDDSAAAGQLRNFTLYEGDIDSASVVTEGVQLFTVDDSTGNLRVGSFDNAGESDAGSLPLITPRTTAGLVDETGATLTLGGSVRIPIRSPYLVATAYGAVTGDVFTVYVYYETAGDYRF